MLFWFRLSLALLAATGLSCTKGPRTPDDTLVLAIGSPPATLDPRFATDAYGIRMGPLIYSAFVNVGDDFQAHPNAAEKWDWRGAVLRLHLKPNIRFHSGRPLAAEDLLYTFDFYRSPKSPFASAFGIIERTDVKRENGRFVVELKLKERSDKFLNYDLPIVRILPKAEIETDPIGYPKKLIGSGPYRFEGQDLNSIRLASDVAKIPKLVFKIVRDDFTRYQKTLKGEIDIAQMEIPPERIKDFDSKPEKYTVYRYPGLSMSYVLLNFNDPLLKIKSVREALDLSIHRQELIQFKLHGLATEATSLLPPNHPFFLKTLKNADANLSLAQSKIKDLGFVGRELTLSTASNPQAVDTGRVLANMMSRSGLKVNVQSYEWGTFYGDVKKGQFQMATMKWVGIVDPDLYRLAFHSNQVPPGRNRGSYIYKPLDEWLDKGVAITDPLRRQVIYDKVQEHVHKELAIIPLWYETQTTIVQKNIRGYTPSNMGDYLALINVAKTAP